jgi:hypothetical protein
MVIEVTAVPLNASVPMLVTPAGMVMEESRVASLKAAFPMEVRRLFSAKVTVASEVVFRKAYESMLVTLAGMVIEVSAVA